MQTFKSQNSTGTTTEYHAEVKFFKAPKIADEFSGDDGIRMYLGDDNKLYLADVVDKIWNAPKTPVLSKRYKGPNSDTTRIAR